MITRSGWRTVTSTLVFSPSGVVVSTDSGYSGDMVTSTRPSPRSRKFTVSIVPFTAPPSKVEAIVRPEMTSVSPCRASDVAVSVWP